MSVLKKVFSAILLFSLLGLAGCPETNQQSGGTSSGESRGGGGGD